MNNSNKQRWTEILSWGKCNRIFLYILVGAAFLQVQCGAGTNSNSDSGLAWESGDVYQDENGWIEGRAGDMPIVISAPHGGLIEPEEVPDRSCPDITTVRDRNTTEMAFAMGEELMAQTGQRPFIVAAYIRRTKIDLNRDMGLATCGNPVMEKTWKQYHTYMEGAISKALDEFGFVIFIDLHGHGHDKQRLELGYSLSKGEIRDAHLDANAAADLASESSLRNLVILNDELDFQALLTGEYAFGTLIQNEGIPAVPSMQDPYPLEEDPYFTGGYNTRRYTSDYPKVFGWQIEANFQGVRSSEEDRRAFAAAFTQVIITYIEEHIKN